MKPLSIRSLLALSAATLLSACGVGNIDPTGSALGVQTAAAVQTSYTATAALAAQTATVPVAGSDSAAAPGATAVAAYQTAGDQAASNQAPQPDCAPEGCRGLRIIDANAEEYRLRALRLAAAEAAGEPAI